MTTQGLLDFVANVRGLGGKDRQWRLDKVVDQVNIKDVLDQPIDTLSKGYKRRVGLAQAILHDPPVLVLDEPTDGLDPNQKHEVRGLIQAMARDKAIIISTHILEEVEAVCSRAIVIARGRIVAEGRPEGDGWRIGDILAEPGRLDAAFRTVTQQVAARARAA